MRPTHSSNSPDRHLRHTVLGAVLIAGVMFSVGCGENDPYHQTPADGSLPKTNPPPKSDDASKNPNPAAPIPDPSTTPAPAPTTVPPTGAAPTTPPSTTPPGTKANP